MRFEDGFRKQVPHLTSWFTNHVNSESFKKVYGELALCKQE